MSCEDDAKKCIADRREKVLAVLAAAEVWETEQQLADKAGVTQQAIHRYKVQQVVDCNKPTPQVDLGAHARAAVMALSPEELVQFRAWFRKFTNGRK